MSGFTWEGYFGIRHYPDWLHYLLHGRHNPGYIYRRGVVKQLERVAFTNKQKRRMRHEKHLSTQHQYESVYGINHTTLYYDPDQDDVDDDDDHDPQESVMCPSEIAAGERVYWPSLRHVLAQKAIQWGEKCLRNAQAKKVKDNPDRCYCHLKDPPVGPDTDKPLPTPPTLPPTPPLKSKKRPPPLIPKSATLPFEAADFTGQLPPRVPGPVCNPIERIRKLRNDERQRMADLDAREARIKACEDDYYLGIHPIQRKQHPARTVDPYLTQSTHWNGGKRETIPYPPTGTGFQTVPRPRRERSTRGADHHREPCEPIPRTTEPLIETMSEYDRRTHQQQGQHRGRDTTTRPPRDTRPAHRSRSRLRAPPAPVATDYISSHHTTERQLNREQQRLADERARWKADRVAEQRSYDLGQSSRPAKTPSPDRLVTPQTPQGRQPSFDHRPPSYVADYRRSERFPRSPSPVDDDPFDEHVFRGAIETANGYEVRPSRHAVDESMPRPRPTAHARPRPAAVVYSDEEYDRIRSTGAENLDKRSWAAVNEVRHRRRERIKDLAGLNDPPPRQYPVETSDPPHQRLSSQDKGKQREEPERAAKEIGPRAPRGYSLRMSCEKQSAAQWAHNVHETVNTRTQRQSTVRQSGSHRVSVSSTPAVVNSAESHPNRASGHRTGAEESTRRPGYPGWREHLATQQEIRDWEEWRAKRRGAYY